MIAFVRRVATACALSACALSFAANPAHAARYTALGDSLTVGLYADTNVQGQPAPQPDGTYAHGFAAQLSASLSGSARGFDAALYRNRGVEGALISQINANQLNAALADAPDLVTITTGSNDVTDFYARNGAPSSNSQSDAKVVAFRSGTSSDVGFQARVHTLLSGLRSGAPNRRIFISNVPKLWLLPAVYSFAPDAFFPTVPQKQEFARSQIEAYIVAANASIGQEAASAGAAVIDLFGDANTTDPANISTYDGFHPNRAGHDKLAAKFLSVLVSQEPVNVSLSPANAVDAPDEIRTFTATYSNAAGVDGLSQVYIRFSADGRSQDALLGRYDVGADRLYLKNDEASQFLGGFAPGSANIVSNSQGKFLINRTLVTRPDANTLRVTWTFKAKGKPTGLKFIVGLRAEDGLGLSDPEPLDARPAPAGFEAFGTWRIEPNHAPVNTSLSPTQTLSAPSELRVFTTIYSDPDGWKNLAQVRLRIKGVNSRSFADDLIAVYNVQRNTLNVVNDAGNSYFSAGGVRPGANFGLSNRRGLLNTLTTTVTRSGNTLTIEWPLIAADNFEGAHQVQLFAIDMGGLTTSYQTLGTWTLSSKRGVAARSKVSTSSAAGNGVNLVFAEVAPQAGYAVAVNGAPVEVTSASVTGSKVSLLLAQALAAGDQVVVTWPGGSTTLAAG